MLSNKNLSITKNNDNQKFFMPIERAVVVFDDTKLPSEHSNLSGERQSIVSWGRHGKPTIIFKNSCPIPPRYPMQEILVWILFSTGECMSKIRSTKNFIYEIFYRSIWYQPNGTLLTLSIKHGSVSLSFIKSVSVSSSPQRAALRINGIG